MKNIIKNIIIILIFILIFIRRPFVTADIIMGFEFWKKSLFPSIFPILIISDYILSSNLISFISSTFGKVFAKLFKVSNYAGYVFLMSMFSGTPSNAKYILDLYKNDLIDIREAEKILSMSLLYNPILILSITSFLEFKDSLFLIISNIIINLIIGFINRNYFVETRNISLIRKDFNLINSISNSLNVLILILGTVITFIVINSLLSVRSPLLSGILEITNGINMINDINILYQNKLLFSAILLSFGGFSILFQIKSIFKDTNINYALYYKSRIYHLFLFILFYFIYQHMLF